MGVVAIGHDVTIGRYFTPETIRLGLSGLAAGSAAGLAWRAAGRLRWGGIPFVLAVLTAAGVTGRSDWPRWDAVTAAGTGIVLLAGLGAARLLADPAVNWAWVAAGAVISAAGVWAGVPETGPALLVGGGLTGLAGTAMVLRARWAPGAGVGVAAVIGWAALSGAAGRTWAAVGGVLCTGVAPWFAVRPWLAPGSRASAAHRSRSRPRGPAPWLLVAHVVLVILAARWIGVDPQAGWRRVVVVAVAGLAGAVATVRRA